jgi:hypothetical protein
LEGVIGLGVLFVFVEWEAEEEGGLFVVGE